MLIEGWDGGWGRICVLARMGARVFFAGGALWSSLFRHFLHAARHPALCVCVVPIKTYELG